MKILFISRWYPYPTDNGSKIRVFNLIKHLSYNHDISLISFTEKPVHNDKMKEMEKYCRSVRTVPYKEFQPKRLKALFGFLSPRPRSLMDTFSMDMQAAIDEEITKNTFDVIVASQMESLNYESMESNTPRVIEELELAVIHEQFLNARFLLSKLRYGLTWWKLSRFIMQMLNKFDGCTVVSEQERDLIMRLAPNYDRLAVVSNGIDLKENTGAFGNPTPHTLIYPGALTYNANFDAMKYFIRDIFPLIKAQHPDVRLRITGDHKGVPLKTLPSVKGVELTGYLDDIRPAVAQSWGCVVPLRKGGGTRLKILEAMALGTPVIATSKGAEGLDVTHEKNILIADDPYDFSQAVLLLLKDENLRYKLSANGRQLVEERYSWDICAAQLEQFLSKVLDKRHGSAAFKSLKL